MDLILLSYRGGNSVTPRCCPPPLCQIKCILNKHAHTLLNIHTPCKCTHFIKCGISYCQLKFFHRLLGAAVAIACKGNWQ